MHLLATSPELLTEGEAVVDLGQSAGDIVFLSAADSELAWAAEARAKLGADFPSLRLANLMRLGHPLSVDLYVENTLATARLIVVRILGGISYWPYGIERLTALCRARGIGLAVLPGDDRPDPALDGVSTLDGKTCARLHRYCRFGGIDNGVHFLRHAAALIGADRGPWAEPKPALPAGLYWPGLGQPDLATIRAHWQPTRPLAAIVFYRALIQGAGTAPVDRLIAALDEKGLNALPLYVASLKDAEAAALLAAVFAEARPKIVLNAVGFALSVPQGPRRETPFDALDCPVLQVIFSGGAEAAWRQSARGLIPRDLAMNVALPEVDGRVLSRAVSFKAEARFDALTECPILTYAAVADRVDFVAALAANWVALRRRPTGQRRIALILANYPTRDGRIGNGVGLDTPEATITILQALAAAGYDTGDAPTTSAALMRRLGQGPTNQAQGRAARAGGARYPLAAYRIFFASLPAAVRDAVTARWGTPAQDPMVVGDAFRLAALEFGNIVVGIQPARGYDIDPLKSHHDPALVPPHGYLAFYGWLRQAFAADAMVHIGKHGNLEWLPGKAVALAADCFPEAAFGPLPHLYPFIVNDPGEGTQAKRRAQAVIIDHLTPPLTRAESYGPLAELERLVDEYFAAAGNDPRRLPILSREILALARRTGLAADCGIGAEEDEPAALAKLDTYLCELKELQIRDGLHVFGRAPEGARLDQLLVALTRLPRGTGQGKDASLIRALAADLALGDFDPLDCDLGQAWTGPKPAVLREGPPWRSFGDTIERLETLASRLVSGAEAPDPTWARSLAVLGEIATRIRSAVAASGPSEIANLLRGLDGRFVPPGPSGAPTRGRPEVLPTGRNFYSVDTRAVPTPAAWTVAWKSAALLLERHRQEHGEWPQTLGLSAWGTANMRTGGEDIAEALALIGARPTWEPTSGRVAGFEVLPLSLLDRPRIDVTLRISGFFRDAFPRQIELFDAAVAAVAARTDEPAAMNPLAARVAAETQALIAGGIAPETAARRARYRIFGSKPGAYGAGLQALIDNGAWKTERDLAAAYLAWGGYAYGADGEGAAEHETFATRLAGIQAIAQNQDNREHDLLDSDDYYQFEGGLAVAVRHLSGAQPALYHNDHSRPESPKIRSLREEVARIVRARVVNPKWIAGVMRHGYKGAFEMAATVDYLFAFQATARVVADHHFDALFDAYLGDAEVAGFLERNNPAAKREIAARLLEAIERGLWKPQSNSAHAALRPLAESTREDSR